MIQDINQFNEKQITNGQILTSFVPNNDDQNTEVMLALSKIKLGDLLSGKMILEQDQMMLKLENGLKLLAHFPNQMNSDQLLDFLVVGKSRQHLELEWVQANHGQHKSQGIEEAIVKEMQLPNNPEMKQLIEHWMNKQLPLAKNQLLQLYHFAKNYDLPTEALVNVRGQEGLLNEQEIQLISTFKSEGMQLVDRMIETCMERMKPFEAMDLTHTFGQYTSGNALKQTLLKGLLQFQSDLIAYQSDQIDMTTNQQTFEHLKSLNQLIQQLNALDFEDATHLKSQTDLVRDVLKVFPKEDLKEIAKQFVHKYLMISQDELLEDSRKMTKLDEVTLRLKNILEDVEKYTNQERANEPLKSLEQMTQALDKYQAQGQYYCFPLQIKEHQTSGELYYFKPKKHKKGNKDSCGMYIVLALDMPSLKHIEVHLIEQKDKLELKIKVVNEEILKQMKVHKTQLRELMDDTMMPIGDISVECLKNHIKEEKTTKSQLVSRLDFRI